MKKWSVYMHVSPDGLIYIGKTSRKPITRWMSGSKYSGNLDFCAAIQQNGGDPNFLSSFAHYYLMEDRESWAEWHGGLSYDETNFFTEADANRLEKQWITFLDTMNPEKGFNRTSGGDSEFTHSEIAKLHNSKAHEGMYIGPNNPFFGKTHTQETKELLKQLAQNRTGAKNPFFGHNHSQEARERNRQAHLGLYDGDKNPFYGKRHAEETKTLISEQNRKTVSSYDLTGKRIQTYPSVIAASKAMGVTANSISECASGGTKTSCGYVWRYSTAEYLSVNDLPGNHALCKPIFQYDQKGSLINAFPSLTDASFKVGVSSTAISNAALGRTKQAGGYLWRYYKCEKLPSSELPTRIGKCRPVAQYDCTGTYIQTFGSIKDAAQAVGVSPEAVLRAAQNEKSLSGGYRWRYIDHNE